MSFTPSSIKVIVLDIDDTLIEGSEDAKDRAWFTVFDTFPAHELRTVIMEEQRRIAGGKGNRKDIARAVLKHFESLSGREALNVEVEKRCDAFDSEVQSAIKKIGVRKEVCSALATLQSKFPLYVNTAIPSAVLERTLQTIGIRGFFTKIFGTPGTKVENLQHIAKEARVKSEEVLFVSDGAGDWKAAQKFGCSFIGVATPRNSWEEIPASERPEILVGHFEEILPLLLI